MKNSFFLWLVMGICYYSCNSEVVEELPFDQNSLSTLVSDTPIVIDNVIACAANGLENIDEISVFLYPREGVTDIRYYEADISIADKNDYQKYVRINDIPLENVFNGYLKRFVRTISEEKWVIVTFFEGGKVHLSNPIRLKHKTQPTRHDDKVEVMNQPMSIFSWEENPDAAIYFQVVADENDNLLSGTYTITPVFQYYKLDNVVLNITTQNPPDLLVRNSYTFTLMGVSIDNWVHIFSKKEFTVQLP